MTLAFLILASGLLVVGLVLAARSLEARSWRKSLVAIELQMPLGLTPQDIAGWLNTVAAATHRHPLALLPCPPFAFEVVSKSEGVRYLLLVPKSLRDTALSGLRAALPGVRLTEQPDYLKERASFTTAIEAAMTNRNRQMSVQRAQGVATALLATLQPLEPGESVVVQWLLTGAGTPQPIASTAARHELPGWISGEELKDGDTIRSARQKQTEALLHASLRIGVQANSRKRASSILGRVWGQHRGENSPGVVLNPRWWMPGSAAASRLRDLTMPVMHWPLILNTREVCGLLPIPVGDVALPGVALGLARQLPPPPGMPTTGVQVGVSNYPDMQTPLFLTDHDRMAHLHVLGPTGVGKSTLLANLITQDIAAGNGVVVIDPKGDLCADVLARIPEHRADDVIVMDAASTVRPVGFNIMRSAHDEQGRELVVDNVIHIWHEIYKDFWGPRSEDVLRGALLTLINTKGANGEPFTLIETPELLTINNFRKFVTEQDGVPAGLESFWHWYRGMRPEERLKVIGPILNKLRAATLRTPIRLMLGQSEGIDLDRVLAEKKVLLVPLSAGTLGAETAGLLGTMLLAALWQAILGRVQLDPSERHPVYLYVDEAQSVLKLPVDLADMLAQARGLGASFTLAHQHLGQIDDKQVKSALLGTVRSQIVFQAMREDAATLAPSYAPRLTADDLMGLARYEFAMRPLVDGQTLAPLTGSTLALPPSIRDGAALAETSRQQHGKLRSQVEASLKERGRTPDDASSGTGTKPKTYGRRKKPSDDSWKGGAE
ncbi:MAG: type IV secretory system conjugative DNA transfer family protein [Candidatus Saccharimonadales bacterium]